MKILKKNQGMSIPEQIGMTAAINLTVLLFSLPVTLLFCFFVIFFIFDFFAARQYAIPSAIVASVLFSLGMNFFAEVSPRIKVGYAVIIVSLVSTYLVTVDIEDRADSEEVVLTPEERKRLRLDSECYDIGRSYGMAAMSAFEGDSEARDITIPFRCRNRESTSRGIRAGANPY